MRPRAAGTGLDRWNLRWRWVAVLGVVLAGCTPQAQGSAADAETSSTAAVMQAAEPAVIYLVRHAEKSEVNPDDPELSPAGQARAQLLVHLLTNANLDAVWSTNTIRTRTTAGPVAEAQGLAVELYDPRAIGEFAASLKERGGRHLVVGHSNTTPGFVEALGGDPMSPIVDPEYDRFYIVTVAPDGHVETVLIRFGEAFTG